MILSKKATLLLQKHFPIDTSTRADQADTEPHTGDPTRHYNHNHLILLNKKNTPLPWTTSKIPVCQRTHQQKTEKFWHEI